jgi:hypothetical protein
MTVKKPPARLDRPSPSRGLGGLVRDIAALDRRTLLILVTVPVVLTLLEYYGLPWHYTRFVERRGRIVVDRDPTVLGLLSGLSLPGPVDLQRYLWWGLACMLLLVAVPALVAAFARMSPRDLGLRLRGTGRDAWTYLALYALFFPVIWLVSQRADFRQTYPFYKPPPGDLGAAFLAFEVVYCLQFFAIEYFFRGFMTLGLKPKLGSASILVMLAPYCMIHYYKPFPEALGAIGAGLVLGALAWRTETIIYGWFLHYAVALSMDLLALGQTGRL